MLEKCEPHCSDSRCWCADFTGECDTKDPDGFQHSCCADLPSVCPDAPGLSNINGLSIWAEG